MIKNLNNATTDFFTAPEPSSVEGYSLLDSYRLTETHDKRLAVLRKVQFRNTKEGKPFVRAMVEDVNGYVLICRMFDYDDPAKVGKVFTSLLGKLVLVEYDIDYFGGSLCLLLHSISPVPDNVAEACVQSFVGKYSMAEARLRDCKLLISSLSLSEDLARFYNTFCDLSELAYLSDESISKGLRGYVLEIIYKVLLLKGTVSSESLIAFIFAVCTWFRTRQEQDINADDSVMLFIASMMDKRVDTASAHLEALSNRISEFTSLFSGMSKVISGDSYLLYNLYRVFVEASTVKVMEAQLPPMGFCSYKNFTIRRS